jgi:hypothetical protein
MVATKGGESVKRRKNRSQRVAGSIILLAAFLAACPEPALGQFWESLTNPQISVPIEFPPLTGLMVKRIAIGKTTGSCGDEVAEAVISRLSGRVEVLDRANLDAILKEQHFTLSDYVDQSTAARLGKITGAGALLMLRADCREHQDRLVSHAYRDKQRIPIYISRVTVTLKGSAQVVDLETAKIFKALPLDETQKDENRSEEGQPEFPLPENVRDSAVKSAATDVAKLLVPYTVMTKVYFYDDKTCDLKKAYEALKTGSVKLALQLSEQNVQACEQMSFKNDKDRSKALGKAYYNLAVAQMLTQQYDLADSNFQKVVQLRGAGGIVTQAIAENNRSKAAAEAMKQTVERTERFEESRAASTSAKGWSAPANSSSAPAPASSAAPPSAGPGGGASIAERLKTLEGLFKQGLITKEEYDKKRAAILSEM